MVKRRERRVDGCERIIFRGMGMLEARNGRSRFRGSYPVCLYNSYLSNSCDNNNDLV